MRVSGSLLHAATDATRKDFRAPSSSYPVPSSSPQPTDRSEEASPHRSPERTPLNPRKRRGRSTAGPLSRFLACQRPLSPLPSGKAAERGDSTMGLCFCTTRPTFDRLALSHIRIAPQAILDVWFHLKEEKCEERCSFLLLSVYWA